tara:strand:+ start:5832 stop:6020 length:189 start_codon:yes stop_codon:yes gene_type:complete
MARRTKDQIEADEEMTCSNKKCKKISEEVYSYSLYHGLAKLDGITDLPFCEKCFNKKEEEYA